MRPFEEEAIAFARRQSALGERARQTAAVSLLCGFDLTAALGAKNEDRLRYARSIARAIERERLKGARKHWSYDLNRHIALKQALDAMREDADPAARRHTGLSPCPPNKSGASRRR